MAAQREQQDQANRPHQGSGEEDGGGAWARDRAMIQPEEQPAEAPTAEEVKEAARRRDLASGDEDRG